MRSGKRWTASLGGIAAVLIPLAASSQTPPPPSPAAASPLDDPLRLVADAKRAYQSVQGYTCLFVKREVVNAQMQPEHVSTMKVRSQPFSVYMRWQSPKALEGQEVCYVAGRNTGMMRVHSPGLLGVVGFVNLDPRDPRAMATSRHCITESGIGNLIDRYQERWTAERPLNVTPQVRIGEYEFAKRRCTRVEVSHPGSKRGDFYAYRAVLYFDKETHLPIRSEAYDWPRQGGAPDGDLLECFSYVNLIFNVPLGDEAFNF